jgi:hypothetical protein
MEDVMRFPSINDVSAELRRINKQESAEDDDDGGIDVRLQVMPDSTWTVNWGLSDYDQDHHGYWGSSSVPGDNRRFDSKDIARDLIEQAREHKATGGDVSERSAPKRVAANIKETRGAAMNITIPEMDWTQISGDMNPSQYGAIIARGDGTYLELVEIQPVREFVGDDEARDVGFPFWSKEAHYDLDDLDPSNKDVQSALKSVGLEDEHFEDMKPQQRALAIAEALLRYGVGGEEGPAGWSKDVLHEPVKWWSGAVAGAEYLADEDDEFRREILGEEDEDEELEEEEDE